MIETDSFKLPLPDCWAYEQKGNQFHASSSDSDSLLITSIRVSGDGSKEDLGKAMDQLETDAVQSMISAAEHPDLHVEAGPVKGVIGNGIIVNEMIAYTRDKSYFLWQQSMRGPRTIVLATYEGPIAAMKQLLLVREMFEKMQWL